ncbi:MAG TPA: metalloregulator ArsR/SmtB family transcription factor [Candidatus Saccharimonadales bacterium]|nr:metalloregulator ArsR/SmtB family transcription factor [Candidatus Saccharimonadales bacterium]
MVEYTLSLDDVFGSLADPTRRDILQRVSLSELSVSDIAAPYDISLAAVSKHLKILEKAKLVMKRRRGKQYLVQASPLAFKDATDYLEQYAQLLNERMDSLENYLREE